jgi:uncharacterized protein
MAALSAPFILANSIVGLAGALYAGQVPSGQTWLYAIGALAGAIVGTVVGLRWFSQAITRYVLAAILGTAGLQPCRAQRPAARTGSSNSILAAVHESASGRT